MTPDSGGDVTAVVVAILGISLLGIAAVFSVSTARSRHARAKLVSGTAMSLAIILLMWAMMRFAGFINT